MVLSIRYQIPDSYKTWVKGYIDRAMNGYHCDLIKYLFIGGFLFGSLTELFSQAITTTTSYTTSGGFSFSVPAGINSVTVECWGAGGAGGGNNSTIKGGGGGGGGAYSRSVITVTPLSSVPFFVGQGGNGSPSVGLPGQDSWFNSSSTLLAKGGQGGFDAQSGGTRGFGGSSSSGIGLTKFDGAPGGIGYSGGGGANAAGGGGGSSAGTGNNGTQGGDAFISSPGLGGISPAGGGNGGNGGWNNGNPASGFSGSTPGGAGGGAGSGSAPGGNGANGKVIIAYTQPSAPGTPTAAAGPVINAQENAVFSIVVPGLSTIGASINDILTLYQNGISLMTHVLASSDLTSGYTFTNVTLTGGDGSKSITTTVTNSVGNVSLSSSALTLSLDATAPTLSSIVTASTTNSWSTTKGTSASSVAFTVTFSESVTGVDASDFSITNTGSVSSATITNVTGSGTAWTVTVGSYSGTGTFKLIFPDTNDTVMDAAGNPTGGLGTGNGVFTAGQSYSIVLPEPSSSISALNVTLQQSTSINVQWNDVVAPATQATHYLVLLKQTSASFPSITDGTFLSDDNDLTDGVLKQNIAYENILSTGTATFTGLSAATSYNLIIYPYTLSSFNTNDNIDFRTTTPATTTGITAPPAPVVSAASSVLQTSFSANWVSSTAATSYFLDVSTDNFAGPTYVTGYNNLSVGNVTTYAVNTNLGANTTYSYRLRATNSNGTSNNSSVIAVTTAPAPPVASAASSVTNNSFNTNWSASAAATGYFLDISTDNFAGPTFVTGYNNLSVGNVTTYAVNTNLTATTTYYYRLRATNSNGTSNNSSITTLTTAPAPPVVSAASSVAQTSFSAIWVSSASATGYFLDVSTDNFGGPTYVTGYNNVSVGNVTTYAINTNLSANTTYAYRLRATNSNGTSNNSSAIAVTTAPAPPVVSAASSVTDNSFSANWSASIAATGYFLDLSASNTFASFVTGYNNLSVGNVTTYAVNTNLSANTTYYYRLRATNSNGTSNNSSGSSITTAPALPAVSAATVITSNSFTANWSASAAATGYFLDASSDNFTTFLAGYNGKALTATSETISGLLPNNTYQYRVRATNSSGTSVNSSSIIVLTLSQAPVTTAASLPTQTGFTANWNAIAGITDFKLDVSSDDFVTRVTGFDNLAVTGTSKAVTGLTSGITYKYRLRAVNSTGPSTNSNVISIITVPATPVAIAASAISQTGLTTNWNFVIGADNYLLDISLASDFSSFVTGYNPKSLAPSASNETVTGLTSGATYYYRVRAKNTSGEGPNSSTISQITIPANPVANSVVTKSSNSFFANWNAVDGASSYELDVSPFSSGFATFVSGYNAKVVAGGNIEDLVIGLSPQTAYSFRVRAVNAGGKSGNSNTKTMITDASSGTQPVFTVTISSFNNGQFSGSPVNVQGQVSNGVGTISGTFVYKGITETATKEKPITVTSGSYAVSVDETMLDELGIEFFVKARDQTDAEKVTTTERIYRIFTSAATSPSVINSNFEGTRASIKIISIPYDLNDNLIESIFTSLGVYDKKGWRLAHYLEGQGNVEYKEGINKIERGKGYWFNARAGSVNVKSGEGSVGAYTKTNPFKLSLVSGWNQIGNPYPFSINWSDVLTNNPTISGVGTLKVYNSSKANYDGGDKMGAFTGGFVHADNNVTLDLKVSLRTGGRIAHPSPNFDLEEDSWTLPLVVKQNNSVYDLGAIGMAPSASLSKDAFDEIRLPRLEEYLDITFDHPESRFRYFTQDIIPTVEQASWKFDVGCNVATPNANLEWDNSKFGNNAAKVWLLDVSEVRWIDMRAVNEYSFYNPGKKEFRIYYSRNGQDIIPDILTVSQPYPNPASSAFSLTLILPEHNGLHQVDITLLDMLGKPVSNVFSGEKTFGVHTIVSTGVDSYGNKLPSGVYLIRSKVNDQFMSTHRLFIKN